MRALVTFALVLTLAPAPEAQAPKPNPAPAPQPADTPAEPAAKPQPAAKPEPSITAKTDALVEPPGFAYNAEGRRDPFLSLARRGVDARAGNQAGRGIGLAGLSVAEVTLRGTLRSRDGFVAIMQGADQRAYIVRPGDKLFDGTIRTVSQNDVVILQQVNDPLSLEKQREVRKVLRQAEAN